MPCAAQKLKDEKEEDRQRRLLRLTKAGKCGQDNRSAGRKGMVALMSPPVYGGCYPHNKQGFIHPGSTLAGTDWPLDQVNLFFFLFIPISFLCFWFSLYVLELLTVTRSPS